MTQETADLVKKVLALPAEARAALAGSLPESLDEEVDTSGARRIQKLDSGKVRSVAWSDARRQISDILNGR